MSPAEAREALRKMMALQFAGDTVGADRIYGQLDVFLLGLYADPSHQDADADETLRLRRNLRAIAGCVAFHARQEAGAGGDAEIAGLLLDDLRDVMRELCGAMLRLGLDAGDAVAPRAETAHVSQAIGGALAAPFGKRIHNPPGCYIPIPFPTPN